MAKNSSRGKSHEQEVYRLARRIMSNASYISKEDIEVLEHLTTRGDYPDQQAQLKPNTSVDFVDQVEEFNKTFNKPNNYEPTIPEEKEWKFVYDFVLEELEEYRRACENGDIVEVLDALCDIAYVSLGNGTMLHGLKDKIWPSYQEVQASNMSKSCKTEKEAMETVRVRSEEQGEPCHFEKVEDRYVVYRTRDRKVMKSINYFRPDLTHFFTNEELAKFHKPDTII